MSTSIGSSGTDALVIDLDDFDPAGFDPTVPLVLRDGAERARRTWTDDWLVEQFGDAVCQVSLDSRPAMAAFQRYVPLQGYMAALSRPGPGAPRGYLFHSERDVGGAASLLDDLDVPQAILELGSPSMYRFFMGPADSGTLPHVHTYALNALARGRKRWAIYRAADRPSTRALLDESDAGYGSGSQARDWFARELPQLRGRGDVRLWEFEQGAGQLIFIPAFTIHAVVNVEPVMGFTVELRPQQGPGPVGRGI